MCLEIYNHKVHIETYFFDKIRKTERSDTLIVVRIIEGLYNGGLDNRGCTVL